MTKSKQPVELTGLSEARQILRRAEDEQAQAAYSRVHTTYGHNVAVAAAAREGWADPLCDCTR